MATVQGLVDRLRQEMADQTNSFQVYFDGDGATTRVDLPVDNVATIKVYDSVDPANPLVNGTDYVLDAYNGIVVFSAAPLVDVRMVIDGTHANLFTDEQLTSWVETAFALHDNNRNPPLTYSTLDAAEEYMIVLLARHEALWALATDAAMDIDVRTVEGVTVPRSQRYAQLMSLIQGVKGRYDELARALNLGPNRIEMMTLRRKSRLHNRLVPVYVSREIDDTRPPQRVFPAIDTQGAPQPTPTIGTYNLAVRVGEPYSETLTFTDDNDTPIDLSGHTVTATIFKSKYEGAVVESIDVDLSDGVNGKITLSLTKERTQRLERYGYDLVWRMRWEDGAEVPDTPVQGSVLLEESFPQTVVEHQTIS